MGGVAKTLLPVLPLVALGVATGGGGLAAAPAVAGSAASTAAAGAGLTAAGAGVAPVAGGLTNVAAGAAAGGGLFSTSNLLLASTALNAVGGLMSGAAEAQAAEAQAQQAELQAAQERLSAADRELSRQQRLRRTLAAQRAIFGARGIDVGVGSPLTLAGASIAETGRESDTDQALSTGRLSALGLRARNARADAGLARIGQATSVAGSLVDFGINRRRIGLA